MTARTPSINGWTPSSQMPGSQSIAPGQQVRRGAIAPSEPAANSQQLLANLLSATARRPTASVAPAPSVAVSQNSAARPVVQSTPVQQIQPAVRPQAQPPAATPSRQQQVIVSQPLALSAPAVQLAAPSAPSAQTPQQLLDSLLRSSKSAAQPPVRPQVPAPAAAPLRQAQVAVSQPITPSVPAAPSAPAAQTSQQMLEALLRSSKPAASSAVSGAAQKPAAPAASATAQAAPAPAKKESSFVSFFKGLFGSDDKPKAPSGPRQVGARRDSQAFIDNYPYLSQRAPSEEQIIQEIANVTVTNPASSSRYRDRVALPNINDYLPYVRQGLRGPGSPLRNAFDAIGAQTTLTIEQSHALAFYLDILVTRHRFSNMHANYPQWRAISGDGNCFYTGYSVCLLEHLRQHQDQIPALITQFERDGITSRPTAKAKVIEALRSLQQTPTAENMESLVQNGVLMLQFVDYFRAKAGQYFRTHLDQFVNTEIPAKYNQGNLEYLRRNPGQIPAYITHFEQNGPDSQAKRDLLAALRGLQRTPTVENLRILSTTVFNANPVWHNYCLRKYCAGEIEKMEAYAQDPAIVALYSAIPSFGFRIIQLDGEVQQNHRQNASEIDMYLRGNDNAPAALLFAPGQVHYTVVYRRVPQPAVIPDAPPV